MADPGLGLPHRQRGPDPAEHPVHRGLADDHLRPFAGLPLDAGIHRAADVRPERHQGLRAGHALALPAPAPLVRRQGPGPDLRGHPGGRRVDPQGPGDPVHHRPPQAPPRRDRPDDQGTGRGQGALLRRTSRPDRSCWPPCGRRRAPAAPGRRPASAAGQFLRRRAGPARNSARTSSGPAEVVSSRQLSGSKAVTSPWVLTLKKGDVTHRALWKNAQGRMGGYWEGWNYEIAAYLLDKHLGLGMVPPTVEREFRDERGSCQYWIDDCMSLRDREEKKIKMPPIKIFGWNRATYLQRLWDNLIANEDRHANQILITPDWRMVLIDHSRSFRTSGQFTKSLLFSARSPDGPKLMSELPRALVDRVKALDFAAIRAAVGKYLSDDEIQAVLVRRDLILQRDRPAHPDQRGGQGPLLIRGPCGRSGRSGRRSAGTSGRPSAS
ncbi:MAG: hypothetical protein M0C28_03215 [Candidatus Moduliflexus flocculans]|nr:hypothetical protein [Candidatus Moduliflexus flocculans]